MKIKFNSVGNLPLNKSLKFQKFSSVDNLPLKKPLKFRSVTIIIRSVFEEDGKLYPQVFLDDTLHKV